MIKDIIPIAGISLSNYMVGLTELHIVLQCIVALLSILAILKSLINNTPKGESKNGKENA